MPFLDIMVDRRGFDNNESMDQTINNSFLFFSFFFFFMEWVQLYIDEGAFSTVNFVD